MPTAGSTESSLRSRPPPRITQAVPSCSHCTDERYPSLLLNIVEVCPACGNRFVSSITRGSPPCSSTIRRNVSSALPDEINLSLCCLPSATVPETPPKCSIHPASSRQRFRKSSGPPPRKTSTTSTTSSELPIMFPRG